MPEAEPLVDKNHQITHRMAGKKACAKQKNKQPKKQQMKTCYCKPSRTALWLGSAGLVLAASPLLAQNPSYPPMSVPPPTLRSGLYMAADAGVNLADNLTVVGQGTISLDAGVQCDLATGYAFKLSDEVTLAPELQVGVMYNALDHASAQGQTASVSGSFIQVPVMANAVVNWQFGPPFVLYAGAGAGLDSSFISNTAGNGSETDFAWQIMAGTRYVIGASEISLGYTYLAVKPSGLQTVGNNSIMLSYTFHF